MSEMSNISKIQKKKIAHNYTSELELKSLLIRIKNTRLNLGTERLNSIIEKYIKWHTAINNKKYEFPIKRNKIKAKLKLKIIEMSEQTSSDNKAYERFGEIILLMIKNILRKPQFSGYTFKDDFYSDAVCKILKYLNNFDHTKISERTDTAVNAFAYMSQIMHNSILYIIITKKKESIKHKEYTSQQQISNNAQQQEFTLYKELNPVHPASKTLITRMFYLTQNEINESNGLDELVHNLKKENPDVHGLEIFYPCDYQPTFDEHNTIELLHKQNIKVQRNVT